MVYPFPEGESWRYPDRALVRKSYSKHRPEKRRFPLRPEFRRQPGLKPTPISDLMAAAEARKSAIRILSNTAGKATPRDIQKETRELHKTLPSKHDVEQLLSVSMEPEHLSLDCAATLIPELDPERLHSPLPGAILSPSPALTKLSSAASSDPIIGICKYNQRHVMLMHELVDHESLCPDKHITSLQNRITMTTVSATTLPVSRDFRVGEHSEAICGDHLTPPGPASYLNFNNPTIALDFVRLPTSTATPHRLSQLTDASLGTSSSITPKINVNDEPRNSLSLSTRRRRRGLLGDKPEQTVPGTNYPGRQRRGLLGDRPA